MGIFDIFGTGDQEQAARDQIAHLQQGYSDLSGLFGQGRNALSTNYNAALQPLQQNYGLGNAGNQMLARLLGFGGGGGSSGGGNTTGATGSALPATNAITAGGGGATAGGGGSSDIMQTLQSIPGYQFTLDQGNQNILRNQAATGQLNSGGTLADLQRYGQGLASQNYFNYVNALQPQTGAAANAASGIAGVNTGLGQGLNQSYMTQGNAAYGTQAGVGNALAQKDLAGLTQSGNILGAGLGIGAALLSDERAKDDIEPVGELFDGQTVYRYRYKGDPRHQIGLIAQEVEDRDPDAVVPFGDLKAVNYKTATNWAAELGKLV